MKKIYLSLGAVLVAALCSIDSVGADAASKAAGSQSMTMSNGMTFTMGGKGLVESVSSTQKRKDPATDKTALMFKGQLDFEIKSDQIKEWVYGVVASLNLDKAGQGDDTIKAAYLFATSEKVGNFQVGNLEGLERQMMSTGKDILGGADGFGGGRMWRVISPTSGTPGDVSMPASYTMYGTKAVYTTPNVNGWQAGVHYVPSSKNVGTRKNNADLDKTLGKPSHKQLVTAALSYGFGYGQMAVNLYANGSIGKAQSVYSSPTALYPIKTFQFGLLMDYAGWRLGSGYYNNQRSFIRKNSGGSAGQGYDVGIGREMGPVYVALGYLGFSRRVAGGYATSNTASVTVDYTVVPGWTVYGETDFFRMRSPKDQFSASRSFGVNDVYDYQNNTSSTTSGRVNTGNNGNNQGAVFILGTQMRF